MYYTENYPENYGEDYVETLFFYMTVAKNATVAYRISVLKFSLTTARLPSKHAILVAKSTNPKDFPHFICTCRKKAVLLQPILKTSRIGS